MGFALTRSVLKQMVACLFRKIGHVTTVPLEKRRMINFEWFTTICLPVIFEKIRKTNRRIIFHHDNASSHKFTHISDFLNTENVVFLDHLSHNPELVPSDFTLLPHIKNNLAGALKKYVLFVHHSN